jgi:hypothetical protein
MFVLRSVRPEGVVSYGYVSQPRTPPKPAPSSHLVADPLHSEEGAEL